MGRTGATPAEPAAAVRAPSWWRGPAHATASSLAAGRQTAGDPA